MLYHSSNRKISNNFSQISFKEALLKGLAEDEGLYMPLEIPQFGKDEILALRGKPYHEVAFKVLNAFIEDEIDAKDLLSILKDAYTFEIPIEKFNGNIAIARLDQGPTASFKDFAARFMARMMRHFKSENQEINILVATSGDTGSAVGEAFRGLKGSRVFILYPENEVSPIQKKQLESMGENVLALSISGKFDDCQRFVKMAFADKDLTFLNLSSANSINIGRVLPQIVYYFYIYLQATENFEPLIYSVPSGNLGNSLGCEIARRMGLPVAKILIATNGNKAFPAFLEKGTYQKIEPSLNCISNAMNVGNPSNLARYFDLYGGTVDKNGKIYEMPDIQEMRKHLQGFYITDEETSRTIQEIYQKYQSIIEPHGAVAWAALQKYFQQNPHKQGQKAICIETAHPAKFPEVIESVLQISPKLSPALQLLNQREGKSISMENDYELIKNFLLNYCL